MSMPILSESGNPTPSSHHTDDLATTSMQLQLTQAVRETQKELWHTRDACIADLKNIYEDILSKNETVRDVAVNQLQNAEPEVHKQQNTDCRFVSQYIYIERLTSVEAQILDLREKAEALQSMLLPTIDKLIAGLAEIDASRRGCDNGAIEVLDTTLVAPLEDSPVPVAECRREKFADHRPTCVSAGNPAGTLTMTLSASDDCETLHLTAPSSSNSVYLRNHLVPPSGGKACFDGVSDGHRTLSDFPTKDESYWHIKFSEDKDVCSSQHSSNYEHAKPRNEFASSTSHNNNDSSSLSNADHKERASHESQAIQTSGRCVMIDSKEDGVSKIQQTNANHIHDIRELLRNEVRDEVARALGAFERRCDAFESYTKECTENLATSNSSIAIAVERLCSEFSYIKMLATSNNKQGSDSSGGGSTDALNGCSNPAMIIQAHSEMVDMEGRIAAVEELCAGEHIENSALMLIDKLTGRIEDAEHFNVELDEQIHWLTALIKRIMRNVDQQLPIAPLGCVEAERKEFWNGPQQFAPGYGVSDGSPNKTPFEKENTNNGARLQIAPPPPRGPSTGIRDRTRVWGPTTAGLQGSRPASACGSSRHRQFPRRSDPEAAGYPQPKEPAAPKPPPKRPSSARSRYE